MFDKTNNGLRSERTRQKCFDKTNYSFFFIKKDIPGYFFKDDALILEGAIRQFVYEYVTHYYKSMWVLLDLDYVFVYVL